jgi:D-alanyl-D-alanine carboxypeptidase/D-alanyl-D-alanine-endopeptidase (penicillin-binding protein 4)
MRESVGRAPTLTAALLAAVFSVGSATPAAANVGLDARPRATGLGVTAAAPTVAKASSSKAGGAKKPAPKAKAAPKKAAPKGKAKAKTVARATPAKRSAPTAPVYVAIGAEAPLAHPLETAKGPAELAAAKIEALLRGPLKVGTTSVYVADATSGDTLFSVAPDKPLNPASNVKLLSTATALDLLGADYRYSTRVIGPSPDDDGVIAGDVYLRGTYDPTLTASGIRELAAALAARGVRRLTGDVLIGDVPTRDGIYRAGMNVNIKAGELGKPAIATVAAGYDLIEVDVSGTKTRKKRGALTFAHETVKGSDGRTRVKLTVKGPIGRGRSADHWISFDTLRAHHAAHLLRAALRSHGVEVTGDVRVAAFDDFVATSSAAGDLPDALAEHTSEPLAAIVAQVNKRSINWLADRVIMTAAAARFDEAPSMDRAVAAMHEWLGAQADAERADEVVVDTGSGLSYRTQFSARNIVNVLRRAGGYGDDVTPPMAEAYRQSLSIAGVDGTLRHRFGKGSRGLVRGKTGTLSTVIALSGFVEVDPTGRWRSPWSPTATRAGPSSTCAAPTNSWWRRWSSTCVPPRR